MPLPEATRLLQEAPFESNPFQTREPKIKGNPGIRTPQREAYNELVKFAETPDEREVGIVLPVGCGKSGCIAIAPFAFRAARTLVVSPSLKIAEQLRDDFDPARPDMFYRKCGILDGQPYPEPAEIRGLTTNRADLEEAHVVLTNIQQLQGDENRWLANLPGGFFDLILFDEGHHNVAESWDALKRKFPNARIVNFSATPLRGDGKLMAGRILYSYPVYRAIQEGYVKRLKAVVLNPRTLRFVRREDGEEIEVDLDEVRRLGEQDSGFRRSIVTSAETLQTIADASLRELDKMRRASGENRLKIIASALNLEHCRQVVEAYRSREVRADFVHSRRDPAENDDVLQKLENHELDVIVQVRKLGEGFDHPLLSVAAIFSVFGNLSPFIQFVGRIMRVIAQNSPGHVLNFGSVVFHAGSNIASRWSDFREYSEADRDYFDQLLPMEDIEFGPSGEVVRIPGSGSDGIYEFDGIWGIDVRGQSDVGTEEIPLITKDPDAMTALKVLRDAGYAPEQGRQALEAMAAEKEEPEAVPETKVRQRQAKRSGLDVRVREEVDRILEARGIDPQGSELDSENTGRINFVILKAAIDRKINASVGRESRERHEFTRPELDQIDQGFDSFVESAEQEIFGTEE